MTDLRIIILCLFTNDSTSFIIAADPSISNSAALSITLLLSITFISYIQLPSLSRVKGLRALGSHGSHGSPFRDPNILI